MIINTQELASPGRLFRHGPKSIDYDYGAVGMTREFLWLLEYNENGD